MNLIFCKWLLDRNNIELNCVIKVAFRSVESWFFRWNLVAHKVILDLLTASRTSIKIYIISIITSLSSKDHSITTQINTWTILNMKDSQSAGKTLRNIDRWTLDAVLVCTYTENSVGLGTLLRVDRRRAQSLVDENFRGQAFETCGQIATHTISHDARTGGACASIDNKVWGTKSARTCVTGTIQAPRQSIRTRKDASRAIIIILSTHHTPLRHLIQHIPRHTGATRRLILTTCTQRVCTWQTPQ